MRSLTTHCLLNRFTRQMSTRKHSRMKMPQAAMGAAQALQGIAPRICCQDRARPPGRPLYRSSTAAGSETVQALGRSGTSVSDQRLPAVAKWSTAVMFRRNVRISPV